MITNNNWFYLITGFALGALTIMLAIALANPYACELILKNINP
jgi:mannose/fructose/N-acetylgalactosamine-specific phosphotransferase system component IIC